MLAWTSSEEAVRGGVSKVTQVKANGKGKGSKLVNARDTLMLCHHYANVMFAKYARR